MLKEEKKYLKNEFNRIIDEVPKTKKQKLYNELKELNKYFDKYDIVLVNWGQNFKRGVMKLFSKDVTKLMKNYVDDLLDGYDKGKGYEPEDREILKNALVKIVEKYDNSNRTLLDKILSVLGFT